MARRERVAPICIRTLSGTLARRTCSTEERICARSRSWWATRRVGRSRARRTCRWSISCAGMIPRIHWLGRSGNLGSVTGGLARIVFGWVGSLFGALVVAVVEAREAVSGAGLAPARGWEVALAEFGVLAPLALAAGLAVSCVSLFLQPAALARLECISALRARPLLLRSRTAAVAALAGALGTVWVVAVAHAARDALGQGAAGAVGVSLATTSVAMLVGLSAVAFALLPLVRRTLSAAASLWPRAIHPVTTPLWRLPLRPVPPGSPLHPAHPSRQL